MIAVILFGFLVTGCSKSVGPIKSGSSKDVTQTPNSTTSVDTDPVSEPINVKSKTKQTTTKIEEPSADNQRFSLSGRLLTGEELDWDLYQGKVVLVDFWATWCGPCRRELPNVKENYDRFHAKGFEVIGVSLDYDEKSLKEFLEDNDLPWPQIFDGSDKAKMGWNHPLAKRFKVNSIPAVILVDQNGKVVSTKARGTALKRLLSDLLGNDS